MEWSLKSLIMFYVLSLVLSTDRNAQSKHLIKQNSDQDQAKARSKGKRDDGSCLVLWNRHLGKETISLVCENYSTEFISTCGLYIVMNAHIINPFGLLQIFFLFCWWVALKLLKNSLLFNQVLNGSSYCYWTAGGQGDGALYKEEWSFTQTFPSKLYLKCLCYYRLYWKHF